MIKARKIKEEFPILSRKVKGKPLVYLDNAATSQKPEEVISALDTYYRTQNANIHRGIHTLAEEATEMYEGARGKVAKFVGAASSSEVIFTSGTTESINLVAQSWGRANLKPEDTVLLTVMEHHSNLVPWQILSSEIGFSLEFIHVTKGGYLEDPEETIRRVKPKLLGFVHVSNVLGTKNPVKKLVKVGHDVGALVLVDGAQAVPQLPINLQSLGADFYAFSGHKMFGPTGIGVLFAKADVLKDMPPFMGGGEMIKEVYLRESVYKNPPHKFEAGTPKIAQVAGLGAAVDFLNRIGMEEIQEYEEELTSYALEKISSLEDVEVYGPLDPAQRGAVVSFNIEGIHPHDLAAILDQEGVAVRSGNHCAMPLHDRFKITASCRASFALYNQKEDVDSLISGIEKARGVFKS